MCTSTKFIQYYYTACRLFEAGSCFLRIEIVFTLLSNKLCTIVTSDDLEPPLRSLQGEHTMSYLKN